MRIQRDVRADRGYLPDGVGEPGAPRLEERSETRLPAAESSLWVASASVEPSALSAAMVSSADCSVADTLMKAGRRDATAPRPRPKPWRRTESRCPRVIFAIQEGSLRFWGEGVSHVGYTLKCGLRDRKPVRRLRHIQGKRPRNRRDVGSRSTESCQTLPSLIGRGYLGTDRR